MNAYVSCVAVQLDGKVLIGGPFTSIDGMARTGIARLHADGSFDASFAPGLGDNPGLTPSVFALALQLDGKAILGGNFKRVNGITRVCIARLNPDVPAAAATLSVQMFAGLTLSGPTRVTYRLEYTSNLTNQTLWHTLTDLSLSNTPQFYLDTTSLFSSRRFYRAVSLP